MAFRAGMKVVCIDASPPSDGGSWGASDVPVEGAIYTVRAVVAHEGCQQLLLNEINRSDLARKLYGPQIGYWAGRFRPVQERKSQTDISIFLKMLQPKKVLAESPERNCVTDISATQFKQH
jgi:hypothetical protein